jgi:hypothetical protein
MEQQKQTTADKQTEVTCAKKPYATPELWRLGNVEQVTQGLPSNPVPDNGTVSF